jgi:glyoxylate reductase
MHKQRILVTGRTDRRWLNELDDIGEVVAWEEEESFLMPRPRVLEMIRDFDAVINFAEVHADQEFVLAAKKLKIIANVSIGFDNLDLPLLTAHRIWASNAPGFFNYPVAEYVLAGILALKRKLLLADDFVRKNEWKNFEPGRWDGTSLKFQTLGIIGMGSIGRELRRMAEGLGINVIFFDPGFRQQAGSASQKAGSVSQEPDSVSQEAGRVSFNELLTVSDIISIHVPLNPTTDRLFDKKTIAKMKKGAVLVNTSRGSIIDENALINALEANHLSGAVLDVFAHEPDVPDQLKRMKNVLLTPHMAGGTIYAREGCVRCAAGNVLNVLKGNSPPNALNNPC